MFKLTAGLFVCALWLSGCNTMEGFGRDVESAGESIEERAERNRWTQE